MKVADNLRRAVSSLGIAHKRSPKGTVTVSIGVAGQGEPDTEEKRGLLEVADAGLLLAGAAVVGLLRPDIPLEIPASAK
jgi:PleD family two-component response regulator